MILRNYETDERIEIEEHIEARNGYEYYVLRHGEGTVSTRTCLVWGAEVELKTVYIPDVEDGCRSQTCSLNFVTPPPGWDWE